MKKDRAIVVIEEDLIFSNLPEEKQREIRDRAMEILKEENPDSENPRVAFMMPCLLEQKIRELVCEGIYKGEFLRKSGDL